MVITEAELRELWQNGRGAVPAFPPGTRFSPAAQDFLEAHRIEVRVEPPAAPAAPDGRLPEWDKPASFPVVLSGPAPVCSVCGQPLERKPGHMTQLDAGHFAPKTHPRIRLRGKIDTLHALLMLTAAEARRYLLPRLADGLDTLAAYCREIQSAEYNARRVQPLSLHGKTEDELHALSHRPDRHLGLPHLAPGSDDHVILHWLNVCRANARALELVALEVYGPKDHTHAEAGPGSLAQALNRLSSALYVIELLFKRGDLGWKANP